MTAQQLSRRIDLTGQRFGRLTVVHRAPDNRGRTTWECICDCGKSSVRLTKVLRQGFARSCGCLQDEARRKLKDHVTYGGAHIRVRRSRGPAVDHPCADCGQPASDWSYVGGSDHEQTEPAPNGTPLRYSPDPSDYAPRCRPCHMRFDGRTT